MIKYIIINISIIFSVLFSAEYDVGDTVDLDDQDQRFTVCNGEHFGNDLSLADLNGDLNGGLQLGVPPVFKWLNPLLV